MSACVHACVSSSVCLSFCMTKCVGECACFPERACLRYMEVLCENNNSSLAPC